MSSGKILIVDDEPQIRRVMRTTLSAQGYEIADSRSGEEALLRLREERFDLILLDMNMPGMGGLAACREIRATSDVSIIILTVRNEESEKIRALDAGADDYVTKPFSIQELLARIRAAIRRTPSVDEAGVGVLELGGVSIDLSTRTVTRNGAQVRLTPKEFSLLQYFIAHPNATIPHGKLLQAIWGPDYGDEVEYLRVFVNQLRKKIENEPAHPKHLQTVPWVGYRFNLP